MTRFVVVSLEQAEAVQTTLDNLRKSARKVKQRASTFDALANKIDDVIVEGPLDAPHMRKLKQLVEHRRHIQEDVKNPLSRLGAALDELRSLEIDVPTTPIKFNDISSIEEFLASDRMAQLRENLAHFLPSQAIEGQSL